MGIVGKFSPKYITAMFGGQALGGIFTALTEICSLWIGASPVLSGLVYFIIGDAMLLLSLIAYIILERAVSLFFIISGLTLNIIYISIRVFVIRMKSSVIVYRKDDTCDASVLCVISYLGK